MSLEYYNRDTKDLLYNRPISATTGFLNYLANIGQLNNKGVEFELRTINFASPDFNWTSVLNLTHNRNKIVTLDGDMTQSIEGSWFIHKIGLFFIIITLFILRIQIIKGFSGHRIYSGKLFR